jgi:hypothetical protein
MNLLFPILLIGCLTGAGQSPAQKGGKTELLLDPAFRGTVKLYTAPDKRSKPRLLRHNVEAEDWIFFKVQECNDSMIHVSAEYSIQGHIASGWIDKNKNIGVYTRAYNKSLVLYAAPKKGDIAVKITHYVRTLVPVTDCQQGWVKVKMVHQGKPVEGWLSPEEQCADAYTTCN